MVLPFREMVEVPSMDSVPLGSGASRTIEPTTSAVKTIDQSRTCVAVAPLPNTKSVRKPVSVCDRVVVSRIASRSPFWVTDDRSPSRPTKTRTRSVNASLIEPSVPCGVGSMMSINPRTVSAPRRKPITQSVKVTRIESGTRSPSEFTTGSGAMSGVQPLVSSRALENGAPGTNPIPLEAEPASSSFSTSAVTTAPTLSASAWERAGAGGDVWSLQAANTAPAATTTAATAPRRRREFMTTDSRMRKWAKGSWSEELGHVGRSRRGPGEAGEAQPLGHQPQRVLMLVQRSRREPALRLGADRGPDDAAAAVRVVAVGFVEDDDEQPVGLKRRTRQQRGDVGLQPGVGDLETAVVGVVAQVRHHERVVRQRIAGQVGRELRERHEPLELRRVVHHIGEERERVVLARIAARLLAGVADRGQILRVRFPRLPGGHEVAYDVVLGDRRRVAVAVGDDLPRGQHEVVADRGMRVGVVLCGVPVLRHERVQIRHVRAVGLVEVVIFSPHDDRVREMRQRSPAAAPAPAPSTTIAAAVARRARPAGGRACDRNERHEGLDGTTGDSHDVDHAVRLLYALVI